MKTKLLSVLLVVVLFLGFIPLTDASNIVDINDSSVFLKADGSTTCTLVASLMMFRRGALINNDSNWDSFTESTYVSNKSWWAPGLPSSLSGGGMNAERVTIGEYNGKADERKQLFKDLLQSHPEGVVIWLAYGNDSSHWHAVLLTDYDSSADTFYCADSYKSVGKGRITLSSSLLATKQFAGMYTGKTSNTQEDILTYIHAYWYIKSGINYDNYSRPTPPEAPSGLVGARSGSSNVQLKWNAVSSADRYEAQYSRQGVSWTTLDESPVSTPSLLAKNFTWNYDYVDFRVRAVNAGGASPWAEIRVYKANKEQSISVTGVSLNKYNLSLKVGESETLIATVQPSDASNKKVYWWSNNESVATVDQSGKITAVAPGTAVVDAETYDGNFKAYCTITVSSNSIISVAGVSLNKYNLSLKPGESETLSATVQPSDASNKKVYWWSNNESVVTVDQNGKITAVAPGTAVVDAETYDGNFKAYCTITVSSEAPKGITVVVDGKPVDWTDAEPFISNNRTLVPLRAVANALGLKVTWESKTRTALFSGSAKATNGKNYNIAVSFVIDSRKMAVKYSDSANNEMTDYISIDSAPLIKSSRTYAPIRFLAEHFGYTVKWDSKTKTITITSGKIKAPDFTFANYPSGDYDACIERDSTRRKSDGTVETVLHLTRNVVIPDSVVKTLKAGSVIDLIKYGGFDNFKIQRFVRHTGYGIEWIELDDEHALHKSQNGAWLFGYIDLDNVVNYIYKEIKVTISKDVPVYDDFSYFPEKVGQHTKIPDLRDFFDRVSYASAKDICVTIKSGKISSILINYVPQL